MKPMPSPPTPTRSAAPRRREDIPTAFTWNLSDIYADWPEWQAGCTALAEGIDRYAALQGTLARGADRLLAVLELSDVLGQLAYKVYYYAALKHDEDQRDNEANGRRQQVQALLARWSQSIAWFHPELLRIPLDIVRAWMEAQPKLGVYRFALEEVYRLQAHVLDHDGERLLSLANRLEEAPHEAYEALSTADVRWPTITLSTGEPVEVTYGRYRAILETNRVQADRALAFRALHETFASDQNTYAALYHGVLQRDWFVARARRYETTLDAALFGNAIPPAVVENLLAATRAGVAPLQRYHQLRRRALGLETYHMYDGSVPIVEFDRKYEYAEVLDWLVASVAPLGLDYQADMRRAFDGRWIDVYENPGKRSGAYSAAVYGVHPYMLLNYNETLDAVFTLAHEMGHSMHTLRSHAHQPFVYSDYTIFVAEVPSTLSEALFLEFMLQRADDPRERVVLLQHAIDSIVGTFYTQVLFADFELEAHRLVERGEPVTADVLGALYMERLRAYHGDAVDYDDLSRVTWARIPHFFNSPYYVYQYATCFASTARLVADLLGDDAGRREATVARYLGLLKAGGSDQPMILLERAGVDLSEPATVGAVVDELDRLVSKLEAAVAEL